MWGVIHEHGSLEVTTKPGQVLEVNAKLEVAVLAKKPVSVLQATQTRRHKIDQSKNTKEKEGGGGKETTYWKNSLFGSNRFTSASAYTCSDAVKSTTSYF